MDTTERAVYRGQITKLVKSASEYLASPNSKCNKIADSFEIEEELCMYVARIMAAHDSLKGINAELRQHVKPENMQKEFETIIEYEDKATAILARLNQRLRSVHAFQDRANGTSSPVTPKNSRVENCAKLPKLSLSIFNGELKNWIPFWERFRAAVHDRDDISGADKFNYLANHLSSKAAESIAGFTPSSANYDAAIALLLEQFGDSEKLIDNIMQQLMNLPRVTSRSDAVNLRKLYNSVITYTRSLTVLNVPSIQYSIMLKTLILDRLPRELVVEMHKQRSNVQNAHSSARDIENENASVSAGSDCSLSNTRCDRLEWILLFLKREIASLESLDQFSESKLHARKSELVKPIRTAAGLLTPAKELNICFFCNSNTHSMQSCNASIGIEEKKSILKKHGCCFRCTRKGHNARQCLNKRIRCTSCFGNHVKSMCDPRYREKITEQSQNKLGVKPTKLQSNESVSATLCSSIHKSGEVLLQTARVLAQANNGISSLMIRIILDGGSQRTYIKRSVAHKLNLQILDTVNMQIVPFGSSRRPAADMFDRVKVKLHSTHSNDYIEVIAIVVPDICPDILQFPHISTECLSNLSLADDYRIGECENGIGMLLGADVYWLIVKEKTLRINDRLVAVDTIFGWTLQGPIVAEPKYITSSVNLGIGHIYDDDSNAPYNSIPSCIARLWNLDDIHSGQDVNADLLIDQYVRENGTRYEASLLWKNENCTIDGNRNAALVRLQKLVTKLSGDFERLKQYYDIIQELISSGVAEKCNDDVKDRVYYMPHRPVYRMDKETTKTRIVFDASAKTGSQLSLNELLWAGPNLLPNTLTILLNFRIGKYALTADVEKAFLQIELAAKDRDVHRFFWLQDIEDNQSVIVLRMARVTFGVTCSPFLLSGTLKKHFRREANEFPNTCRLLNSAFYVDDFVASIDEYENAVQTYREACEILKRASMNLRKWRSNDKQLRKLLNMDANNLSTTQKVLGIVWDLKSDDLAVDLDKILSHMPVTITKRTLLQTIAGIYDPLGMLSPYVVKLKLLFQATWKQNIQWDEPLPVNMQTESTKDTIDFRHLCSLKIPRSVFNEPRRLNQQLHVFADASPHAYGIVAFVRSKYRDGSINVSFLCSKNRIAPIRTYTSKQVTLPKLELAASSLAAEMASFLRTNVGTIFDSEHLWTDSKIALYWIKGQKYKKDVYISNRINKIHRLTNLTDWKHCPGVDNPADLLTRGVNVQKLMNSSCWLDGPSWLKCEAEYWPEQDNQLEDLIIVGNSFFVPSTDDNPKITSILEPERFSDYRKLLRVTAYVLRFLNKIRKKESNLTTESCILALRRFFARRGVPDIIMSDNAKTFKRSALEFREIHKTIQSEQFQNFLANKHISWQFIVERAAWWGGFWERLVKSVKDLLKASIQRANLNFDQLSTYLSEAEFIINARPLTYVSDDPRDLSPLTPANFIFGSFPSTVGDSSFQRGNQSIQMKWQERLRFANRFFKRFRTEYVQMLRSAHHGHLTFSQELKVGDVVIVHDSSVPRLFWKLGMIKQIYPGRDNRIRSCDVELHNGLVLKRAVQHLFPMEVR